MANIPIPYTFIAGTIIDPDQMNANFQAISTGAVSDVGGTIDSPIINGPVTGSYTLMNGTTKVVNNTDTGTVNDWAPGLAGNTFIRWAAASDVTITGLAGGVAGQVVTIKNINAGAPVIYLAHFSAGSLAVNRFVNFATSAPTPLTAGGSATYVWNSVDGVWVLIAHEQGAWMTTPFASGDFSGLAPMVWSVDAGDVTTQAYRLSGRTLTYVVVLEATSISGTPSGRLQIAIPGGFTAAKTMVLLSLAYDAGWVILNMTVAPAATLIQAARLDGSNFSASANSTYLRLAVSFEVN